ncbi:hypothetical protein QBC41DRAFT_309863 [Cercophora samala]|uniref:YMC020W-like alpha/beta hydrolase domain-containing protein n=1 Tax=Cercophora samala TaxID=330535 RepID=A0AA40DHZ7_9PEZI|nr:hypothetical protein QBC41DRAFT_309863 [Cercophora samala]
MAPRKRAKPNPVKQTAPTTQSSDTANQITSPAASTPPQSIPPSLKTNGSGDRAPSSGPGSKQVNKTRSWYGSLSKKSTASTQVARETILGGTSKPMATADFTRFDTKKSSDMSADEALFSAPSSLSKSQDSGIGFTSDGTRGLKTPTSKTAVKPATGQAEVKTTTESEDVVMETEDNGKEQEEAPSAKSTTDHSTGTTVPAASATITTRPTSTWLGGWWGSSQPPAAAPAPASQPDAAEEPATQETESDALAGHQAPENKMQEPASEDPPEQQSPAMTEAPAEQTAAQNQPQAAAGGGYGSWIWGWGAGKGVPISSQSAQDASDPTTDQSTVEASEADTTATSAKEPEDTVMKDAPPIEEPPASTSDPAPKTGSTWAFWSRQSGSTSGKKSSDNSDEGQLAVMGESSQNHPKRAKSMEFKGSPPKETPIKSGKKEEPGKDLSIKSGKTGKKEELVKASAIAPGKAASIKRSKRDRPESMEIDDTAPIRPGTPTAAETPTKGAAQKPPVSSTKAAPPNLVLPSFNGTYKLKENPSIVKQITRILLRGSQAPSNKHVYISKDLPKIKKAIAIGVHGLFPANYLRTVIGQPTGTSIKFANHTADAIRRWADKHGCGDCEIEKVALEGEGKIGERVENLWNLLLNWIDQIRSADVILIGCHSQGVPVSIMLLAKLIEMGVVNKARVGVCAMAGVSLGPFPDYRTSMGYLMGSAGELWAFGDPKSEVSQRLEAAMKVCLGYGARITLVGSIDDQLVPMESAVYAPVHHPYIFRAAFIDGRIHAPDFIAHLVGFALKLRNLGVSDHGLIRELSTPLAGSLYSGEGHSRLYDDEQVYDLAVCHALETTDVGGSNPACEMHRVGGALVNPNPYHLPWIMRGLLEEDFVKTELSEETQELVRQFDDWKPVTKALKDVKYRLEAVRSKL